MEYVVISFRKPPTKILSQIPLETTDGMFYGGFCIVISQFSFSDL